MALRLQRTAGGPACTASFPLCRGGQSGGALPRVNRDRFVRAASVLVGLLLAALLLMMILLPDRLSRVAEMFLR